ncbi:MGMT family protein [Candidatus Nomurabacteria bacterium]|nr:MGMT family protein [Candidatus Nomurabacteria bacterium]
MKKSFTQKVHEVVKEIPKGSVLTYQQVAEKSGSPGAYRAVGSILKKNYDPSIPCHRVIKSNGEVGQYNRGNEKKIELLREEGVLEK